MSNTPTNDDAAAVAKLRDARTKIKKELAKIVIGQDEIIDSLLIGMLCKGHILLHGVPGLGKTLMARTLARTLQMEFRRIQFTPDLMPADITGTDVMEEDHTTGKHKVSFLPGPVFTNFLLADEINRTPPKTQAALLQAMQEAEISVGRETYKLKPPFFVVATQNPIEQEGTYPLPEAQLDRFMFKVVVPFLNREELNEVVSRTILRTAVEIPKLLDSDRIMALRKILEKVVVTDALRDYAVRLVLATHPGTDFAPPRIRQFVKWGASPRAAQALIRAARVRALSEGRAHVAFEDVRHFAGEVLGHRMLLNYDGQAENLDLAELVQECVKNLTETM